MTFEHYGSKPLSLDFDRSYAQSIDHKPKGFWISVKGEDDWPTWCLAENFGNLDYLSEIELDEEAHILKLESAEAVKEFHEQYKKDPYSSHFPYREMEYIDWEKVAEEYDGIIIAPYQWSLRMNMAMIWYYSWDVASGCIWNLKAIKSITPVSDYLSEQKELSA